MSRAAHRMRWGVWGRVLGVGGLLVSLSAAAWADAEADDGAALSLADTTPLLSRPSQTGQVFVEGWVERAALRPATTASHHGVGLDLRWQQTLTPAWQLQWSDRLTFDSAAQGSQTAHALREAFVSWRPSASSVFDLGRVNLRQGLALGYNPSDSFKADVQRSLSTLDPNTLRANRLGVVTLRGQWFWTGGALSAAYAPQLGDAPRTASAFSPDWGSSNPASRWLVQFSHAPHPLFNPQWSLSGGEGQSPQLGLNLSFLLGSATVLYGEYAGGRDRSQLDRAAHLTDAPLAWRQQFAGGVTHTFPNKLSLTAEYQTSSAAPTATDWLGLQTTPAAYGAYRQWVGQMQGLTTRRAAMVYARWQDCGLPQHDLTLMLRQDGIDQSRQVWLESRIAMGKTEWAVQWQRQLGVPLTVYGAMAAKQSVQATARYYF